MSHSYIDRSSQNGLSQRNGSKQPQRKIDPVAQLKALNDNRVRDWGLFDDPPAQLFARDEDLSSEAKEEDKVEKDPIIVGRQNGSGAPITSTTYKCTIDVVSSRINDATDSNIIEVLKIAKQGSKLSKGLKTVNNITGYIGAISSLYNVSQGGSPIEGIPLVGSLVAPMWEMSGMGEMEREIDLMIAKESYENMVDYASKTPEIGFVYSDQEFFSCDEHEGYYISPSYYPTNYPFVCRDDAYYQTGVELFYAYWGYLQDDGSLWVKGKLVFN